MPSDLRRPHLVQRGDAIQKPDIVANIVVVEIREVRVHGVVVEVDVGLGVRCLEPGLLRRDVVNVFRRRAFLLALLHRPVVTVVGDGADDLFLRDHLQRILQVLDEPVLAGDRPGIAAGIVLVIVHQDQAVGDLRDGGIVKRLVVDRNRDVQLQALGVKIVVELLHQRAVVAARTLRERPRCRA